MSRCSRAGQSHVSRSHFTIRRACIEALEHRRLLSFGDLDPLFGGGDGKITTNFGSTDTARAAAFQADGKILVAGSWDGGASDFALARYNPNGTVDTTFGGGDGLVNITFGAGGFGGQEFATDLAIQSDGKIVAVGYTDNINGVAAVGGWDFAVARLNTDGTLDATFSGDGKFTVDTSGDDRANSVALRADGKIIVGGSRFLNGTPDFSVIRLNTNGTLDVGFSGDGLDSFTFGFSDFCEDLAVQFDNKIVMVGYTDLNGDNDMAVVRFLADGGLDNTFDTDGRTTISFGADDRANAVAIDDANRVVLAGSWDGGASDYAVVRLTTAGALDSSFSGDGLANATFGAGIFGGAEFATDLVVRPDFKIDVLGYTDAQTEGGASGANNNFGVLRLNTDGSFDNTFDSNGRLLVDFGGNDLAYGLARHQDGTLIAAGITGTDFAVTRLRGALDISFAGRGIQKTNFGNTDTSNAVLVQPDGKILVAGSWDGGASDFALARYNPNGTLDNTFGGGFFGAGSGLTNATFGNPTFGGQEFATDMALQPDGKIILVGYTDNVGGVAASGGSDLAVARFNANGSLDNTFSGDGRFTFDFSVANADRATGVAVRPNGKIVVGGYSDGGGSDFVVLQFNANGTLDASFGGGDGWAFGPTFSFDPYFARDLALQADGKIVLVGDTDPAGADTSDIVVARFTATGDADATFDGDGFVTRAMASTETGNGVVVDQVGRIVVVGNDSSDMLTLGFRSTGADDPPYTHFLAFGITEFGTDITIAPDGRFVLTGYSNAQSVNDFIVARMNPNGSLDTSFEQFGTTGGFSFGDRILIDLGGDDRAFGAAVQPDGHILLAGTSNGDFAIARLAPRMIAASAEFQFETIQQVLVQFSSAFVGLTTTDFTLQNLSTLAVVPAGNMVLANLGNGRAQLRFPGESNLGVAGALPDGNYRLTLPPGTVTDTAGNLNVGTFTFDFFFKMADADRDRDVDLDDFNILATNFNTNGHVFSGGNFNYSAGGGVNLDDFNLLASLFNTSLSPASSEGTTRLLIPDDGVHRPIRAEEENDALSILS